MPSAGDGTSAGADSLACYHPVRPGRSGGRADLDADAAGSRTPNPQAPSAQIPERSPPVSTRPVVSAAPREVVGKSVNRLRRQGLLPAVVYGHGHASQAIQIDAREFETVLRHAGRHTLIDLKVGGGKATPVLLQHVHEHPVKRVPQHVDLFVVKMTEEISIDVPVHVIGESLAVDRHGGTLLHLRDAVTVRALPADLPSHLELDISPLDSFDAVLHISDLIVPEKVTVVTDAAEPLARVQAPRVEEEPVEAEAAAPEAAAEEAAAEGAPAAGTETSGSDEG
jgi:large subunit ribosomal protein L25